MRTLKGTPTQHWGSFALADLPVVADGVEAGDTAYVTNGRKAAEGAGVGTGNMAFFDGTNWIRVDSGVTANA